MHAYTQDSHRPAIPVLDFHRYHFECRWQRRWVMHRHQLRGRVLLIGSSAGNRHRSWASLHLLRECSAVHCLQGYLQVMAEAMAQNQQNIN